MTNVLGVYVFYTLAYINAIDRVLCSVLDSVSLVMDDDILEEDLKRRFPRRFAQDVAPFKCGTASATIVEQYNLNGNQVDNIKAVMDESEVLVRQLRICGIFLKAASAYRSLGVWDDPAQEDETRVFELLERQSMPRLRNTKQKMLSKRREWLDTVGGSPGSVHRMVQSQLLNLEPTPCVIANDAVCSICLDSVDEDDFAFVCANNHVFHFTCSVEYVSSALTGCVKPSTSLQCPMRCGCFFVFNGEEAPSPKLAERSFKRIVVQKNRKRKSTDFDSECPRPSKRQTPLNQVKDS